MARDFLAADIMSKDVLTLDPKQSVKDVAKLFLDKDIDVAPVLEDGKLVGIVTETDLVMQEVRVHFPTYVQFLEGYIYLGGLDRFEDEFRKALAATVDDVMTSDLTTARSTATISELATLMEERRVDAIPILGEDNEMVGIVTKRDIIRAIMKEEAA